ncbi:Het-eN [Fusarium subglutinans]|uniref:Het-eN n=1 Tax=Gibberella subglutinans TaxID=42677 RepID=A0A8H5P069_GIBSU|nr:Het-eN [Fusarium subglutinans]KAF5586011.1 Het-eN [Fusarium subglutinans]
MSGIEVIGLVSAILTILETIGQLSDAIKNAKDLPPAFREVADKLPIVREILQSVEKHLSTSADQRTDEAIQAVLKHCREKAKKLEKLFKAVDPSEDTSSFRRYALMVRSLGKGHRVEVLSKGMMEDVKLLVQNHTAQAATEEQVAKLTEAIEEISSMEPSLAEEEAVSQTHYGSGDNVAGSKSQYAGNHNEYHVLTHCRVVHSQPQKELSLSQLLLRSLVFEEMDIRPTEIEPEAAGTCRWIFQHKIYRTWESRDRSLLWLKGKPGSGKSTLLRYILDNIVTSTNSKGRPIVLSFFFSGRGTELQKTPGGLYRSLLCQMESKIPQALEAMEMRFRQIHTQSDTYDERWMWNTPELRYYARTSLRKALETHPIILLVDALDECGQKNAEQLAEEFNSILHWPSSKHLKYLRICFTCRHYPVVNIESALEISIDRENARDIFLFVESKLRLFQEQTGSRISEFISQHAEGVFLWASLVVGKVLSLDRDRLGTAMIESEVRQVPQSLEKFYSEIIGQIDEKSIDLIDCICFAARPLTLVELHWAMALAQNQDLHSLQEFEELEYLRFNSGAMKWNVEMLGHGLIECKTSGGVVQFIHQSVKDFFVEKVVPSLRKSADLEGTPHYSLAKICLRYLKMVKVPRVADVKAKSEFPFLFYAMSRWEFHITHLPDDVQELFPWPWYTSDNRDYPDHEFLFTTAPLQIISKNGWTGALRGILANRNETGINVNLGGPSGRTPLHFAAQYGHTAVMELLLASGARMELEDSRGQTPLSRAIEHGNIAAIEFLLERGARVDHNYKVGSKLPFNDNLFYKALKVLILGLDILDEAMGGWFELLRTSPVAILSGDFTMHRGAPEKTIPIWRTPLSHAAELGDEKAVRLLLKYNARPKDEDVDGETPLSRAEKNDRKEVIQILRQSMGQG